MAHHYGIDMLHCPNIWSHCGYSDGGMSTYFTEFGADDDSARERVWTSYRPTKVTAISKVEGVIAARKDFNLILEVGY